MCLDLDLRKLEKAINKQNQGAVYGEEWSNSVDFTRFRNTSDMLFTLQTTRKEEILQLC